MYLTQGLRRSMQQTPHAIASIYKGRRRTFAELGDRVARMAGLLRNLGLKPGDRVGMLALNSDWYVEFYLGVYWAGGVVNPINTRWSPAEIAYSLEDCQTDILIVDGNSLNMLADLRSRYPGLRKVLYIGDEPAPQGLLDYEALLAQSTVVEDALRGGNDLAGIFYTGGTTGVPKGVMLSHSNLYTNAMSMLADRVISPGCVGLHAAPMFHLADGAFMNAMFAGGGTHVMVPRFEPIAVFEAIQDEGVTESLLVPTMIQMLVDHPAVGKYRLEHFHNMVYGASPINDALLDRAMKVLPSAGFTQMYGMTELSPVATILLQEMHREVGRAKGQHRSNGKATVSCEVRVVDPQGNEVPRGEVGEVVVRGPGVMLGYWNKPEVTAATVRDGWMHTGDGGRMDEDGYLYVVDRLKDMIITGGENVYSVEVERAISLHPAVAVCAVIGVPDPQWGELVHALIVKKPGANLEAQEVIDHCKAHIANYKCPRRISFVDEMPMSGAGKILKRQLRAPFWERESRKVS